MRKTLLAPLLAVTLAAACSDRDSAPTVEPPAASQIAETAQAVPWTDPIPLAAGIASTHYVPVLLSDEPYSVLDPVTGTRYELGGPDLIEDEAGRPKAFPTGPTHGHVLAAAETVDGLSMVLDYAVRWDANTPTMSGKLGAFMVTGFSIHQLGDEAPRYQFVQEGDLWVRKPVTGQSL